MEEKKVNQISDEEMVQISGGLREENEEIVALFRKYGFEKEANQLQGKNFSFGSELNRVLKGMGFTHKLSVYSYDEKLNRNFYNGRNANQSDVTEVLNDFLYRKANNIEWE